MKTKQQHTSLVVFIALIASTGGLLFGFDTGVISGAIPFLQQDFGLQDYQIENLTACGLIGAVLGAVAGGRLSDLWGRKKIIIAAAFVFASGALWSGFSPNSLQLLISRFYIGTAIGVSSFAVPLYIAEISPSRLRGRLVFLFQFMITIGILTSYLSDSAFANNEDAGSWRPMFLVGVVPALILFIGAAFLPETPRWLLKKGKDSKSLKVLTRLEEEEKVSAIYKEIQEELRTSQTNQNWKTIFSPWLRNALIITVGIMFFQQFVGINTVIYYSPKIFLKAGFVGNEAAVWASVSVGIVNVLFTVLSIYLIDKLGRRKLYFLGLTGIVISLVLMGGFFFTMGPDGSGSKWFLVISMLSYVGFFTLSIGPLGWLLISEVFPISVRGMGSSIGSLSNWGFNALVVWSFFKLTQVIGEAEVFWLFAVIGVLGMIWGYRYIPETRDVSLEEIDEHWRSGKLPKDLKSSSAKH